MSTDAAAQLAAWADRCEAYRSGATGVDPGAPPTEDVRAVLQALDAARALLEPIWLAALARVVPLWRAIEPLLEQPDDAADEPQTGEAGPS